MRLRWLGAHCIDDADALRTGGIDGALGGTVKAPSTLGTFLRSFRWGHVRQLDRVSRELLARAWAAGAGPGDAPLTIDLDSTICETYGLAKEGARHHRLGTGVVSLPYHHHSMVAERMVLLDHLTQGRVILGVGPGALVSDAHMLGIDPARQREMMDESLGIIVRLFTETEPIAFESDWFTLRDSVLQFRPYQQPSIPIAVASTQSPSGVALASKHGAAVLSMSVPRGDARTTSLKGLWSIAEETAAEHGKTVRREDWGLVVSCHLAESRKQALDDIRVGGTQLVTEYYGGILGNPAPDVPEENIVDHLVENNQWIVGNPDDCIASIEQLQEMSGGFGSFMVQGHDWAPREKLLHKLRAVGPVHDAPLPGQPHRCDRLLPLGK